MRELTHVAQWSAIATPRNTNLTVNRQPIHVHLPSAYAPEKLMSIHAIHE
jgi:hypothetical protein